MLSIYAAWRAICPTHPCLPLLSETCARAASFLDTPNREGRRERWTADEERELVQLRATGLGYRDLLKYFPRRTETALGLRLSLIAGGRGVHTTDAAVIDEARNVLRKYSRRVWSQEQRQKIQKLRRKGWTLQALSEKFGPCDLNIIATLCRPLKSGKSRPRFTPEEDKQLMELRRPGSTWDEVAEAFPERSYSRLKNRWRYLQSQLPTLLAGEGFPDVKRLHEMTSRGWTTTDVARLIQMYRQGETVARIGSELGKSARTVAWKVNKISSLYSQGVEPEK